MGLFHRKSRWERAIAPLGNLDSKGVARSGMTAVVSAVGMTAASAAVSAVRRRQARR